MRRTVTLLLLVLATSALGDFCVWSNDPWSALSANGEWRLEVTQLLTRRKDRRRGTLYRNGRRHARWIFVNSLGPGAALVADDGTVVTRDNICHTGTGTDVVVIYRPDGSLVRSMTLNDLLIDDDVALLPRTVNSIQWLQAWRLDEETRRIVLDLAEPSAQKNVKLEIGLDSGELLTPKRRRFVGPPILDPVVTVKAGGGLCEGFSVSSEELLALALDPVAATYPLVAQKARVSGDVVLELVVSETGAVDSVAVVKPLPFGLDQSSVTTARNWHFQPLQRDGRPVRMCGRFVMSFGIVTKPPLPVDEP
jgi:TonB family protein